MRTDTGMRPLYFTEEEAKTLRLHLEHRMFTEQEQAGGPRKWYAKKGNREIRALIDGLRALEADFRGGDVD